MSGDDVGYGLYYVIMAVMLASAFLSFRVPMRDTVRMALIWIAIFSAGVFLFKAFGHHFIAWQIGRSGSIESASSADHIEIPMDDDGHFWVTAKVNGKPVRFLIDSGASLTGLNAATAKSVGVESDAMLGSIVLDTANGPIEAQRARAAEIAIEGTVIRDLPVVVSDRFRETNVIGMNLLAKFPGWRVSGGTMILETKKPQGPS